MLTPQAVESMMRACQFTTGEPTDDAIVVEGILNRYGFHPGRIAENADAIAALVAELPDEFHREKGGGWSFLNMCDDRHGRQWTGLHLMQERLCVLGIAAGKARWLAPREMWADMPGGMPYVSVL